MKHIGTILNKSIFYQKFTTRIDWAESLPSSNWCAVIFTKLYKPTYFQEIISKIADRNVGYVIGTGIFSELIHDWADEEFIIRNIEPEKKSMPHHVITTWDEDLAEALWDAIYLTSNPETEILKVVIIDVTENQEIIEQLKILIQHFSIGHLPNEY